MLHTVREKERESVCVYVCVFVCMLNLGLDVGLVGAARSSQKSTAVSINVSHGFGQRGSLITTQFIPELIAYTRSEIRLFFSGYSASYSATYMSCCGQRSGADSAGQPHYIRAKQGPTGAANGADPSHSISTLTETIYVNKNSLFKAYIVELN